MADGYVRQRNYYGNDSGALTVTALTAGQTLRSPRAQSQLYVQRVKLVVSGVLAGATWDVRDSLSGQSLLPGGAVSVATSVNLDVDMGANGVKLTPLASLVFVQSAPGAVGYLEWDAYQRDRTDVPVTP